MINFGEVPIGAVLPVMFCTYAGSTGASVTLTGLAVTDIEIYKGTSMTQRSSDAGYALIDTDGIDIDSTTGLHGFSIDTGDNTDSGFYAAGSFYNVVVNAVTIDSQTVVLLAATFRLKAAENTAGVPVVDTVRISNTVQTARDIGASVLLSSGTGTGQISLSSGVAAANVTQFGGSNGTFSSGRPEVNTSHLAGTSLSTSGPISLLGIHDFGTCQSGSTSTTAVLRAALSIANDIPNGGSLAIVSGTGAGQMRGILDFDGASDTVTVDAAWTTTPDNTSGYIWWYGAPAPTTPPTVLLSSGTGTGQISLSSGLLAWNPAWDAEVQSEVQDAIEVNHLDHLLAADYDPASKPGVSTALLNELVESDAGVSRFTANALEQAPSGTGASATAIADEVQTRTIAAVNLVNGLAANVITAAATAADFTTEIQSGLATASAVSTLQTSVDDLPTNAELATALAAADDAVLAAIAALNNLSAAQVNAEVVDALATDIIADSVPADGTRPSIAQAIYMMTQYLLERSVSGTAVTVKKVDGSTTLYTLTLNDGTSPTSVTRS